MGHFNNKIVDKQESGARYLLCLTATVTPSQGVTVKRSDPKLRQKDYLEALRFWLHHPDPRLDNILFVENSGNDLRLFRELVHDENFRSKDVEFVSTLPMSVPSGLHYGWAELKMLDEAFEVSRLVGQSSHLIKVTGRLTFPEISAWLDSIPTNCQVMSILVSQRVLNTET